MYNEAKWCFYASNSHNKFQYTDTKTRKAVVLDDILSIDIKLFDNKDLHWKEFNDTIEFPLVPENKYDLYFFTQTGRFFIFGFSKQTRKLIYRKVDGVSYDLKKVNGFIFNKDEETYRIVDSLFKSDSNNSNKTMRDFGIYPIDEQNEILINKIKSGRKDINPWLVNYVKNKVR